MRVCRLELTANSHFSGIPVNTSRSSVHVPTNVFDGEPKVINAIDWSKKLDDTFKVNVQINIVTKKKKRLLSMVWGCQKLSS
jgi:hypothetical protein